jgi:hypothetical protein
VSAIEPLGGFRVDPALMLSIGLPPTEGRNYPKKLGFFRAKEGRDGQWSAAARGFNQHYAVRVNQQGEPETGPKVLPIRLPVGHLHECLDIRYVAFGKDRLAARGETNYAEMPGRFGTSERIRVFPIQDEPTSFDITGPDDPACMGGHHDIPTDPSGKPSLYVSTTLTFVLAEVGSFTTPVAISTKSRKSRDRLYWKLRLLSQTGSLAHWIMLLAVRPDRVSYRDDAGKRHTAQAYTFDLLGPIASLADRRHLTVDEIQAKIDTLAERGLLTAQGGPATAPAALAPASSHSPSEADGPQALPPPEDEVVEGEIVDG